MEMSDHEKERILRRLFEAGFISEKDLNIALNDIYALYLKEEMHEEWEENTRMIHELHVKNLLMDNNITLLNDEEEEEYPDEDDD